MDCMYNTLVIIGSDEQVKEVREFLKGNDSEGNEIHIDFNKIIPTPEEIRDTMNFPTHISIGETILLGYHENGVDAFEDIEKEFSSMDEKAQKEAIEIGKKTLSCLLKYDSRNWNDWSWDNWGTGWNAFKQQLKGTDTICFTTAWNDVLPLMKKLSEMFPDIVFLYAFMSCCYIIPEVETYLIKSGMKIELTEAIKEKFQFDVVVVKDEFELLF